MLAERNSQMRKAVGVLKELSEDERTRMLYEKQEIFRRDMVSRTEGAIKQREIEIAKKLLSRNRPIEEIVEDTGLTHEEVKSLELTL